MDAFSYLSVLISVILGLAITQVLQGYRILALARDRVRWYWPSIVWSLIAMTIAVQHWWSLFGLEGRSDWSFAAFAAILVHSALIYMIAALVLPDAAPDRPVDLKDHYVREVPAFFGTLITLALWSGIRELLVEGQFLRGANLLFHLLFLGIAIIAVISRRDWLHKTLTAVVAILFALYVFALFAWLG